MVGMTDRPLPDRIPHPAILVGRRVRLEPLEREHIPALLEIGRASPEEFRLTSTPVTEEEVEPYYGEVLRRREQGLAYPFTIFLRETDEIIGCTRFNSLDFVNRNTEIGYTWYRKDQFGTASNIESKLLQLTYAFEDLGLHRVSLRTDVLNERSRRAILALGAREEGVMRRHMVVRDGRVRDTALYAITDLDWPEARQRILERFERKLAGG